MFDLHVFFRIWRCTNLAAHLDILKRVWHLTFLMAYLKDLQNKLNRENISKAWIYVSGYCATTM